MAARLIEKYAGRSIDSAIATFKVIEDNARGLIAVAAGTATEPGQRSDYSSRLLIINKQTGELSDTSLSTLRAPTETKGTCAK